jgi:DMSO reductase family type II enzyme chaperone
MNATNPKTAHARSAVYGMLAIGFSYPESDIVEGIVDGRFATEMAMALATCGAPPVSAETLADLQPKLSFEDFEGQYLNAFETDAPTPSVSLYQTSYVPGLSKSELLLELKAFYDNFGLAIAPDLHELEDKLTAELEAMCFLSAKQALAESNPELRPEPYVLAQRDFLQRHLALWVPNFSSAVAAHELPPFFQALAHVATVFVEHDSHAMELTAQRLAA